MRAALRHHLRSLLLVAAGVFVVLFTGAEVTTLGRRLVAKLRAKSAVIWVGLGMEDTVWPLLQQSTDPTIRTEVIHSLTPLATNPDDIVKHLRRQQDVGVRQAMVLIVGELIGSPEDESRRATELHPYDPLAQVLLQLYRKNPDPGIHAAAQWTLQRYQLELDIARIDRELVSAQPLGDRQWYVTQQGHTMIIVPGWTHFMMGSPDSDRDRADNERRGDQRIRRSFCIASHETTVEQFRAFVRQGAGQFGEFAGRGHGEPSHPVADISWYEAAAYCNWLSLKAGIPDDQWCYLPNADGQYGPDMWIAPDYIDRRGYRLPTEAEWEFACRAGTTSPRYFGDGDAWLSRYAAFLANANGRVQPVGRRKPNDLGLFDTLGNVAEWCQDVYHAQAGKQRLHQPGERFVGNDRARVVRGGSAADGAPRLRCAARDKSLPGDRNSTLGFRVARSNL